MEFKDRKFKFFDSIYTIRFVDRVQLEGNDGESVVFGCFNPDSKEILIGLKSKDGKPYKKEQVLNTLRHELMHLVLFEGQYQGYYEDEPLVEWLAKSIGTLINQHLF